MSKGKYRGRPVAIKHLRIGMKDEFDSTFKVGNYNQLMLPQLLTFHQATLSGSPHLETPVSPKYLASVGSVLVEGPPIFPHHL